MQQNSDVKHLKDLSHLLDSKFEGPFGFRFGLDGILGLLPVVGDFITSALSFYILVQAAMLGCTPSTVMRMGLNILVENLFDSIPVVGNLFDFYWKANNKNLKLLEEFLVRPQKVTWQSRGLVAFICFALLLIMVAAAAISIWFLKWIAGQF